jgi:hypothetical protein
VARRIEMEEPAMYEIIRRSLVAVLTALVAAAPAVAADTVADTVDAEIGRGVETAVDDAFGDGTNVPIRSSITTVTYGKTKKVRRNGLVTFELNGSVQGVGWGGQVDTIGGPGPTFDAESRYEYDVPFVLRWTRGFDGTLVYYAHGYPNLGLNLLAEEVLGDDNEWRRIAELESGYVSDGALASERRHAVFAANLSGLRRDGSPAAIALEGPYAGRTLNLTIDVPITRDLAEVSKRLVAQMTGRAVDRTIGTGHSGGALVMLFIAGGVSTSIFDGPRAGTPIFTGGNFRTAYDPASGVVFDGVIPIATSDALVHPAFPATVPVILLGGSADYAGVDMVRYASRLGRAGVDLNEMVRIYQIANLPHNFAEINDYSPNVNALLGEVIGVEPSADSERMAPVVAAAIDNMRAWIAGGTPPPPSRINGNAVDTDGDGAVDAVDLAQAGGTTRIVPFVEDPSIDVIGGPRFELSAAAGFPGTVARYAEVLDALEHVPGSLQLPYTAHRLGGFEFGPLGDARLNAFDDLRARWRNLKSYRASADETMDALAADGLYDAALGRRVVYTKDVRRLFSRAAAARSSSLARHGVASPWSEWRPSRFGTTFGRFADA